MKRLVNNLHKTLQTDLGFILLLSLICIAAFGIFIPFVGMYWDDWVWKFFSHAYSSSYLMWQPVDRPLTGTLHVILNALFGDHLILWQLGNLFFRWADAAAFYWMFKKALPERRQLAALLALFFLLYPGFSEQWISIAFIHHLVPMTLLWLSFGLMFSAIDAPGLTKRMLLYAGSLLLALLTMLTTDYFYGVEIFRVVLLGYVIYERGMGKKWLGVLKRTLLAWWPYGLLGIGVLFWRSKVGVSEGATYNLAVVGIFRQGIVSGLAEFSSRVLAGIYSAFGQVFISLFKLPRISQLGTIKTTAYYLLLLGSFVLGWWLFNGLLPKDSPREKKTGSKLAILGLVGLVLGGLPFWAAGLQYFPNFPNDRLGLSMMFGWSLLLVGLLWLVTSRTRFAAPIFALVLAFSMSANFLHGAAYAQSWEDQQTFWRQFVTRIPALKPGTVVLTNELPPDFMSDLSYMMALNWLYDSQPDESGLDYGLFYPGSRAMFQVAKAGMSVDYDRRMVRFSSDLDHALVLVYQRNNCLYVFNPQDGFQNPNSRHIGANMVTLSNLDQIDVTQDEFEGWPDFFSPISKNNWCYYYERGELELQRGNYTEVARLGDQAFSSGETPKRSWERATFIEGYAMVGRWDDALALTNDVLDYPINTDGLLCSLWARVDASTPDSTQKTEALNQLKTMLDCGK